MDVNIIIPIYNAFDFVKKCIETVIEHTDLKKHSLLLINDKSTDERILPLLNSFIEKNRTLKIVLIDNIENRGFVETVNIGMRYSHHDVIILNSDTEVTKNWLTKIQDCAYSKPAIATVTPLSNNATLASVPNFMSENILPHHLNVDQYAEIVEKCSMNLFPEIPTAHGFCMYIRREAINDIGLFDEKTFGKGYGEENDFSYRCLQAGYRHLLCDNTYIYHKGTQSFSNEKDELINSHLQILKDRYLSCIERTENFIQENPIWEIQQNIRYAINSHSRKNILFVIHYFKESEEKNVGGTTLHVYDLINNMRQKFNFHVLYHSDEDLKYYVTSFFPSEKSTIPLETYSQFTTLSLYNDTFKKDIEQIIEVLKIDLIHIHHMKNMYLDIFNIADEKKTPIIYTLHDFYSICPTIKLFNNKTFLCDYTKPTGCGSCISKKNNLTSNPIPLWRKEFHKKLKLATKIIAPSLSTKNIFLDVYKDLTIEVVGHGYDKINKISNNNSLKKYHKKFNIAFIGDISEEKGLKYLREVTTAAANSDIIIHLFGKAADKKYNKNRKNYIYHGQYLQKDLPSLLFVNDIKLICLMSMWPETYSYTLSESLISEIPVITFNLGAVAERVRTIDAGWILPIDSTANDIFKFIRTIKSDFSGEYKQKVENIKLYLKDMKTLKDMADEYSEIYSTTIKIFTAADNNSSCVQSKLKFYQKKGASDLKLIEERNEYKRIKQTIKSTIPFKQAFKEVQNYRKTHMDSKYRNKVLFKLIWYRLLPIKV